MAFILILKIFAGRNIELFTVSSLLSVLHGVLTVAEFVWLLILRRRRSGEGRKVQRHTGDVFRLCDVGYGVLHFQSLVCHLLKAVARPGG